MSHICFTSKAPLSCKQQEYSQLIRHQVVSDFSCVLQGPEYIFTISGGYCTLDKDTKSVTCVKPEVTLEKTAGTCTHKHTSPTTTFVSPTTPPHPRPLQLLLVYIAVSKFGVM